MIKLKQIIRNIFTLDLRSLAIMRIMLGVLVIVNLIVICSNFEAFISDYGIFPVSTALSRYPMQNYRWFHVISGSYRWQIPLFIIHFIIALSYIFWFKTRISTIILRVFTCSLQWSQHIFLNAGDTVMRLLLFRSIFLPLWEWYSIDSMQNKNKKNEYIYSVSGSSLIIQTLCIYLVSVILKTDICRINFTSIYYALWIDYYTSNLWLLLRDYDLWVKYISMFVYYLEWLWPILYLLPYKRIKTAICLLFIIFHLGIIIFMNIWLFPRYCICIWIWLLPFRSQKNNENPSYYNIKHTQYKETILIILVIVRNIHSVYPQFLWNHFSQLQRYYFIMRLDQNRGMFAPGPSSINGRHELNGVYFNNDKVNLSNPAKEPYTKKPTHDEIREILPNNKRFWFGLLLTKQSYSALRTNRAMYLCNKRNNKHSEQDKIKSVSIKYHRQQTLTGWVYWEIQTNNRWTRDCPR